VSLRAVTAVSGDVLDLRTALPWSARPASQPLESGWNTAGFDDRSWAYAVAALRAGPSPTIDGIGPVSGVRTRFTADPNRPLSMVVRVAPGATLSVNGIPVVRFPTGLGGPPGRFAPAQRLDRTIAIDPRLVTSGINIVSIASPTS
jgi:hypothetical protein